MGLEREGCSAAVRCAVKEVVEEEGLAEVEVRLQEVNEKQEQEEMKVKRTIGKRERYRKMRCKRRRL